MDPSVARRLWTLFEPVHALTYFAPEVTSAWGAAGLDGFWRTYFAGRAAPLASCGPEVVTAAFFGFSPTMVARAVPSVWSRITPERALAARVDGAVAALDARLDPADDQGPAEREAADLLRAAAEAVTGEGRTLAAANLAAPWPVSGTRATLWHGATILREHRGDGHVAACVAADVTGLEANVLAVAGGPVDADRVQRIRGWTPEEWAVAEASLVDRGLVEVGGAGLTSAGAELRAAIEAATDRAALRPWRALGAARVERLDAVLGPIALRLWDSGVIPDPNAIGVPRPDPVPPAA